MASAAQRMSVTATGKIAHQNRRRRRGHHRAQQKLAVATEIPDAGPEGHDQAGGHEQQRPHACHRLFKAERRQKASARLRLIVLQWIDAEQKQQSAGDQQSEDNRRKRGEHDLK